MKKIKYLQDRNPGVPGIIYKLEPENEKQRKLQNVRKLWAAVFDISDIRDIYSGNPLEKKKYEIDHFVPWSFITNDEMWNLMPVNSSLNSSKRDRLPDWNTYFSGFAQNQFVLNQMIYKYERLAHMFRECQRDNLNSLWSMEELYIKGIDENQFIRVFIMLQLSRQNQTMILMNQILVIHKLLGWPFKANPMQRLLQLLQALPDNSFHPV